MSFWNAVAPAQQAHTRQLSQTLSIWCGPLVLMIALWLLLSILRRIALRGSIRGECGVTGACRRRHRDLCSCVARFGRVCCQCGCCTLWIARCRAPPRIEEDPHVDFAVVPPPTLRAGHRRCRHSPNPASLAALTAAVAMVWEYF